MQIQSSQKKRVVFLSLRKPVNQSRKLIVKRIIGNSEIEKWSNDTASFHTLLLICGPNKLLKGKLFDTILGIERAMKEQVKTISKEAFQKCFQS